MFYKPENESHRVAKINMNLKLQVSFHKRATMFRGILQDMTYNDKAPKEYVLLCTTHVTRLMANI